MVQRLAMEKNICSSFGRLPVLRSEMPSLMSITKADLDMDFGSGFGTSFVAVVIFNFLDVYESEHFLGEVHFLTEKALKL